MERSLRVLHVEDSEQDAALLARHLSRAGYELISERVEEPAAMRAALEMQEWDVILCDYSMPHFNALQALALLKEMELDLPFIVISGTVGEAVAVEAMRAGAHDYLMKDNLVRLAPTIERELHEAENHRARRRVEEALRESEDRYRDLVEHSQELICTHDLAGVLLSINPWAAKVLGYSQDDLLKKNMRYLLVAEFRDQFDVYLAAIRRDGVARGLMVLQTANGERRIWEYNNSLRTEGVEVPIVRGMAYDITERKLADESLLQSEERYRLLFARNPQPMWVYDLETLFFLEVNDAAIQHYGYPREEFLAMTIKDVRPLRDTQHLPANISGVTPREEAGIWKHKKKDGTIIDVEITAHEFLFAGRRAKLVLANDVTDRRMLEVQLRHSQKLESIGQLAAGIAHEINTPTQYVGDNLRFIQEAYQSRTEVMKKYAELFAAAQLGPVSAELLHEVSRLLKEADLEYVSVEVPKALKQSLEGVERIAKIVQSMKDFAHPDSTEMKAADLNRAIESTINVARGEWKYVAEMETDFDLSLPPVPCLLGELNQMTLNMIINSAHAITDKMKTEGQGKGLIKISTRQEGDWAVMRISDTGAGIPLGIRARIFDPFFTTKEVGKGTGQGLAISHTVVEKHGGTITFETAEGKGTTFIIRLPLHEIAETPDGLMKEAA